MLPAMYIGLTVNVRNSIILYIDLTQVTPGAFLIREANPKDNYSFEYCCAHITIKLDSIIRIIQLILQLN